MKKLLLALLLLAVTLPMWAQSDSTASVPEYSVKMRTCVTDSGVVLRWAPANYATWRMGDSLGYSVFRYTILRDNEVLPSEDIQASRRCIATSAKPAPLGQWEPWADDKYVAIAAECIYGEVGEMASVSPVKSVYQRYRQQQQRFSFALYAADMSPKAAELSGLLAIDAGVLRNEKYLYKVALNLPDSIAQDTAMDFVIAGIVTPLANLPELKYQSADHAVKLEWDISSVSKYYTSYVLERSDDCGATFVQLNDANIVSFSNSEKRSSMAYYVDSVPVNNVPFQYRLKGIDCFGRISEPSDTIEACGAVPLDQAPMVIDYNVYDNKSVELIWSFPDSLNASVIGFKVYSQAGPNERLHKIFEGTQPTQRSFVDNMPDMTNYYKVSAYNSEVEMLTPYVTYVGLIDSFPPAPPVGLVGAIDTTGIATLSWTPNTESDIQGYRVYTANRPDVEFALLTPSVITDTVYQTKVNLYTLTKKIYYRVNAVDVRDNQSALSEILELSRPDTVRPTAPVFKSIESHDERPLLTWVCSGSSDVARHIVLRKQPDDSTFTEIWSSDKKEETYSYLDNDVVSRNLYIYAIVAEDDSGNRSQLSDKWQFRVNMTEKPMPLKVRSNAGQAKLQWQPFDDRVSHYVVFRAEAEGELLPYDQTTETSYDDSRISLGKQYRYAVKAVYTDGSESILSEIKELK